jgi:methylmalonyl-CoA/ethylmalonyl-CoA epimerase
MSQRAKQRGMFERIDHIGIAVWDIDSALDYYQRELKLRLVADEVLPEVGVRLAYLDAGNTLIQLVEPTTSATIRQFLEERGEGLHHICFMVADIPAALRTLEGESQAVIFPGGRSRYCAFLLRRPNGVTIELTERMPYDQTARLKEQQEDLLL